MLLKNYKPVFYLFCFALTAYILHKAIFFFCEINIQNFHYSLELQYLFFFGISALLYLILLIVKKKNFEIVGMTFLFGTFAQMLLGYLILQPILKIKTGETDVEKISFFITFVLFLLFQTLLTVRLLNEKR
ncbi:MULTISPECIES: hypothetical protein [unclassified Flavobacterium]|uniref:hypothetical protein n=1 Tax=unclassified Flavobacterium TaxID=196869 RepID=UPI0024911876|nr:MULTISPECIES: hypothetical protein [unclassified Flavobacterium]MDQ1168120.1 putative integral membrane protein [Flavobacterium sp. SORGH_AS_0622]BDU24180.1 hypothetical protein FLGSB24_09240 [Flavobacterium sp. GSB-24]